MHSAPAGQWALFSIQCIKFLVGISKHYIHSLIPYTILNHTVLTALANKYIHITTADCAL